MDTAAVVAGLLGAAVGALVAAILLLRRPSRPATRRAVAPPAAGAGPSGPAGSSGPGDGDGAPELPGAALEVLAALDGPVVVLDGADEVVVASPAARSSGLLRERRLAPAELVEAARATRRDRQGRRLELQLPRGPLGRGRVVLAVRTAALDGGHVLVLGTDLTEARRLDEVRRDFVVNTSHELKTPVGAVALLAEAIGDAAEDPEAVRRFAGRLRSESQRLTSLVQDVVDLSRAQGAAVPGAQAIVDVDAVVEEAVDRCRTTAEDRGTAVEVGPPSGARVRGDAELLTTAVRNLVDNALRYSEAGTRVGVGVRRAGGAVEVAVTDQGIGISPQEQERVFERFYRVDPARSRATGGTGLGLSIVKHVAAGHGGDVALWSQVGEGSTFTLRLPEAPAPDGRSTHP
ncbi:cell wall metabolism sensor histidine kinase WalK [Quadrisphaera sp. DSM 44207]|uniref:sensor histidine kinase n=1 Tax=Quadrisphaera sp. DSM 44207 TaxID=1881057 RepID=UPI001C408DF4|nr:ATP-binding protein [Quadrisphaera sp. DSM 44207]